MHTIIIFKNISLNARRLFLIDGLGALVSAFFLGILLALSRIEWKQSVGEEG